MKRLMTLTVVLLIVCILGCFCACDPSEPSQPPHAHQFSDEWSFNETEHWHDCVANDGAKSDLAPHSWDEGQITKPATETSEGVKTYTCTVCSKTRTETIGKIEHVHDYGQLIQEVPATCEEEGTVAHYCCSGCGKCFDKEYVELETLIIPPLEHKWVVVEEIAADVNNEGSVEMSCERGCGTTKTFRTLRVPSVTMTGNSLSWAQVENATGYKVYVDETVVDVGAGLSYELGVDCMQHTYKVAAYTDNEEYMGESSCEITFDLSDNNLLSQHNGDFENPVEETIRLDCINDWNSYPYGNWSDRNGDVGGWYYICPDEDGNMVIKMPAVVWFPGNTTVKKDMSPNCAQAGKTFEISFDIKASEKALTANNNGVYGKLDGYMWDGSAHAFTFIGSSVVKDIATSDTWSNVRVRYTTGDTDGEYAQFNLVYWPEDYVGEDNYVLIDNIEVYEVIDNVAGNTNVDTIAGGDLEMFSQSTFNANRWYLNDTLLIEPSAIGSQLVNETEDGLPNNVFKAYSANSKNVEFDLKGDLALADGGIYKITMRVKKSAGATALTHIGFTAWAWSEGSADAYRLVEETFFAGVDMVSSEEWITIEAYFVSDVQPDTTDINLFFWVTLNNDTVQSAENFVYIDDIAIHQVTAVI